MERNIWMFIRAICALSSAAKVRHFLGRNFHVRTEMRLFWFNTHFKSRDRCSWVSQLCLFGEKHPSSQFLKLFYEQRQKESEKLQAYPYSFNELLKNATKADPKTAPDPEKTLQDRFAHNVRDPFLQKNWRGSSGSVTPHSWIWGRRHYTGQKRRRDHSKSCRDSRSVSCHSWKLSVPC